MKKKVKTAVVQLLKILFSIGLIFWLISSGKLEFSSLKMLLNPIFLLPCLGAAGVGLIAGTERWRQFLISQNLKISFFQAAQLSLIGLFFNFAIPGGVGGDLVKGYYITRNAPEAKMKAAMTVLMDRLIGLFAMLILALTAMLTHWDLVSEQAQLFIIFQILVLIALGFALFWSLTFSRRLHALGYVEKIISLLPKNHSILRTYHALTEYRHSKTTFVKTFLLSLIAQAASIGFFIIAGYGLGFSNIPMGIYLFVVPVAFMVQAVPVSPAGVGVGQAAAFYLFNLALPGSGPVGPATTTAYQLSLFLYGLIGAYFYLGISKKIKSS